MISKIGTYDAPGTGGVLRLNKITDCAVEVHAVASEAIVGQAALGVVHGIDEDLRLGSAVRTGVPGCVFVLMALLTGRGHFRQVDIAKVDFLRSAAAEMDADVAQLCGEAGFVAVETSQGAMCRAMDGASICGHLVTTGAALAALRGVVIRRAVYEHDGQARAERDNEADKFEVAHHERNAVPFQLRTSEAEA